MILTNSPSKEIEISILSLLAYCRLRATSTIRNKMCVCVADLPHRGKVSLPSHNFIVGCDKLYTSIYLSMLWVYIYIRTYKNYKMTKG